MSLDGSNKMGDFLKSKFVTAIVVLATIILAGVAIFTALRLYQLRQEAVAPTAPESQPEARGIRPVACQQLAFTLTTGSSPTPTPTGTVTNTPTPTTTTTSTPTPTEPPTGGGDPTPTNTPTPTTGAISAVSPTPGGEALPDAGISTPTIFGVSLGILILMTALLLAL